jgi:predicted permease
MISFHTLRQDALYALRALRTNPIFAFTAVLTLALGIGANTAVFTVIRTVLLKPLQYSQPDQLVQISGGATPIRFDETKSAVRCFQGVGAFSGQESLTLSGARFEPEVLNGARVSANFLSILEVNPIIGRSFLPTDDSPGGRSVVLISSELWNRRFNADPQIVGKTLMLAAAPYTVIGVLPPRFQFPFPSVDVWLTRPAEWPLMQAKSRALSPFLSIFGRLNAACTLSQANAEIKVIQTRYAANHPAMLDAKSKKPESLKPWKDTLVSGVRPMLWMLFGATSFVLLITCANVASLLLARATSRTREFAVRAALGASRARLISQVLTESLILASFGGAIGVLLAVSGVRAIPFMTALQLPRSAEIHVDGTILAFACAISLGAGIFFGLAPALGATRRDLIRVLRGTGAAIGEGTPRRLFIRLNLRGLLVISQVALSVVLLIGAALLIESLTRLRNENLGFSTAHLLTFRVSLPASRYDTEQKKAAFFQEATQQISTVPGVTSVTAAMFLPLTGFVGTPAQNAALPPLRLNERPIVTLLMVQPAYFKTLAIPMRRGRDFTERDKWDAERVAVIDETTARHFWPGYPDGLDPVGQSLLIGGINAHPARIIGIVADAHQNLENTSWPETIYVSFAQDPQPSAMIGLRTMGDPLPFANSVRQLIRRIDPDQPISDVRSMDDLVDEQVGQRRLVVGLLSSFSGVAVLLALIGLYGIIAYSVSQRVQELGIRRALGAQQSDILRLIMRQGIGLTLAGILIGIAGAIALARVSTSLSSLLFHTNATDPATFVTIATLFAAAAIAASYLPARRALRIDAMSALRNE